MNFIEIAKLLDKNVPIRRSIWPKGHRVTADDNHILTWEYGHYDTDPTFLITTDAILATDWEIYQKLHTFEEALKALKEGKIIKRCGEKFVDYFMNEGNIFKRDDGDTMEIFCFSAESILADDWVILYRPRIGSVTGNRI